MTLRSPFILFLLVSFLLHSGFALLRMPDPLPPEIEFQDGAAPVTVRIVEMPPPQPTAQAGPPVALTADTSDRDIETLPDPEPMPDEPPEPQPEEQASNPPPEPTPQAVEVEKVEKAENEPAPQPKKAVGSKTIVRPAAAIRAPKPPYPRAAVRRGIENVTTIVRVQIDTSGRVTHASLVRSCGREDMDRSALGTIERSWRFRPATRNGAPVPASTTVRVHWRLD